MLPEGLGMNKVASVAAHDVYREFGNGSRAVHALQGFNLTVQRGEIVAIMGPSGCGKTTALHLLGGLDDPDRGEVLVDGVNWHSITGKKRAEWRRRRCGYIFQTLALLPMATAAENVEVPLLLDGMSVEQRQQRVSDILERVGLTRETHHLVDQLSGGQQQRVAIARALVHEPLLVLADEPTGSLDSVTAQSITTLLVGTARELEAAVILVTHDRRVAAAADRILTMDSGRLTGEVTPSLHADRFGPSAEMLR
jgi:ABC-type lipoprotein export system ATPase subunit